MGAGEGIELKQKNRTSAGKQERKQGTGKRLWNKAATSFNINWTTVKSIQTNSTMQQQAKAGKTHSNKQSKQSFNTVNGNCSNRGKGNEARQAVPGQNGAWIRHSRPKSIHYKQFETLTNINPNPNSEFESKRTKLKNTKFLRFEYENGINNEIERKERN